MLVAGVDSSTQSCKVLVVDTASGEVVRTGSSPHPDGTSVDPAHWWTALKAAVGAAGGLHDVSAVGVGGQQHGMVLLDRQGEVVRDALLWNDTRSAPQAAQLVSEAGADWWAQNLGNVPVASFTVTKLAWVRQNDAASQSRAAAVCLPHDWLTYRLRGGSALAGRAGLESALTTDRGDASGTGYWSPITGGYQPGLVQEVFGKELVLPQVLQPWDSAGKVDPEVAAEVGLAPDCLVSVGSGDNMAAALGLNLLPGAAVVSIGTSGTAYAVTTTPSRDNAGLVAGFADATGNYLPLACTLNATQVLDRIRSLAKLDYREFDEAALRAPAGSAGLTLIPYLQGERTPNLPDATGSLHGLTLANFTAENLARAGVEAVLCSLAEALAAVTAAGPPITSVSLIGGGASSAAVRAIAPAIFGLDVLVPPSAEYVAYGMAKQAARSLGISTDEWAIGETGEFSAAATPEVLERFKFYRDAVTN